jgi:hypothetical protein
VSADPRPDDGGLNLVADVLKARCPLCRSTPSRCPGHFVDAERVLDALGADGRLPVVSSPGLMPDGGLARADVETLAMYARTYADGGVQDTARRVMAVLASTSDAGPEPPGKLTVTRPTA